MKKYTPPGDLASLARGQAQEEASDENNKPIER